MRRRTGAAAAWRMLPARCAGFAWLPLLTRLAPVAILPLSLQQLLMAGAEAEPLELEQWVQDVHQFSGGRSPRCALWPAGRRADRRRGL